MNREEKELLNRAREGDMDAFSELFEPLRSMSYAVAYRIVGANEAEDVVMKAYLKAWKSLPRFRGGAAPKTWLYRITHNSAIDHKRSRQRKKEVMLSDFAPDSDAMVDLPDTRTPPPDAVATADDLARSVHAAMSKLSEEHETVLTLRYTHGFSYAEIAASTGVSIGTVMSRIFNAKKKLRLILEKRKND